MIGSVLDTSAATMKRKTHRWNGYLSICKDFDAMMDRSLFKLHVHFSCYSHQ